MRSMGWNELRRRADAKLSAVEPTHWSVRGRSSHHHMPYPRLHSYASLAPNFTSHNFVYIDPVGLSSLLINTIESTASEPNDRGRSITPLLARACPIECPPSLIRAIVKCGLNGLFSGAKSNEQQQYSIARCRLVNRLASSLCSHTSDGPAQRTRGSCSRGKPPSRS